MATMKTAEGQLESSSGLGEVIYSEAQIRARVAELGAEISHDYEGLELCLIGILKGALFFLADLMRALTIPSIVDFMAISRFGPPSNTHGEARLLKDLDISLENRHALVIDNIVDTGFTLSYLMRALQARNPASLEVCVFLNRPRRRLIDLPLKYIGFEAPDEFMVGYGLGLDERLRQLPYIAYFDPEQKDS
ncbi:MAG: hypoxanthine phosphoribosyltransferase [Anaerolineae bacterium]|nr:MAG: hypoxanthine phosphoribosyltransferase [Anaerolineae bacterium]